MSAEASARRAAPWDQAIAAWRAAIGDEHVIDAPGARARAGEATLSASAPPPRVILRPESRAEVQACLRVASAHRGEVRVHPVSSGKNWGYGSGPSAGDCAILHLGRLDRISDYDERLGTVTVQAGVTQRQLFEFLRARGGKHWADVTAASPDCSIVGNTMERGVGFTPYADHAASACALEVVLPDGERVRTGMARFEDAAAARVHRWGVGPHLDGLFMQSSLGVVTEMTLWLMPAPEAFAACYFNVADEDDIAPLIERLAPLRMRGTLRGTIHIYNTHATLTSAQQYPWGDPRAGGGPLGGAALEALQRRWDLGAWHGNAGLYGTRREVAEARRAIERALHGRVRKLRFLDERTFRFARAVERPYAWLFGVDLGALLRATLPGYGLLRGEPTEQGLRGAYWRKRSPAPESGVDPARDRCGLIFCAPAVPFEGEHVAAASRIARATLVEHGFDPSIALNAVSERCVYCNVSILYDRDEPGAEARARRCHEALLERLARSGYYPYRLGAQSMDRSFAGEDGAYGRLLARLKDAVDPHRVLAPGRYE